MSKIQSQDIHKMTEHWLSTPVNAYLGSDYGQDLKALLQRAQSDDAPDEFLNKMRADIPILQALPNNAANLYGVHHAPDRLDLVIEIAGKTFDLKA